MDDRLLHGRGSATGPIWTSLVTPFFSFSRITESRVMTEVIRIPSALSRTT